MPLMLYRTQVKRALERRAEVVGASCHQGLQRSSQRRNRRPRRLSLLLVPHHQPHSSRSSSSHPFQLPNILTTLPPSPLQTLRLLKEQWPPLPLWTLPQRAYPLHLHRHTAL